MPVSEHEETGVKPATRQSSDYIAGIPIKKRKFPIIRPPSPPCEEPSLFLVESSSVKEQTSQSLVSTCTNLIAVPSSSKLSDTNKNPELEAGRGSSDIKNDKVVTCNANYAEVKAEEPSLTVQSRYFDCNNKNVKLESTENVTHPVIYRNELNMPSNQSFEVGIGNNVEMNQKAEVKIKTEVSAQLENVESFLSVDKKLTPVSGGENCDKSYQNQDSSDSISLNLSLSEERCNTLCKSDGKLNIDSSHLCANRANWDLNTTMDAWDGGSVSDVTYGQMSIDGSKTTGGTLDMKSMTCSTGIANTEKHTAPLTRNVTNSIISSVSPTQQNKSDECSTGIANTEKHAAPLTRNVTNSIISSVSPTQQNKSDESLNLHLSPSFPQSSMSYGLSSDESISTGTLPKLSISTGNLNAAANLETVKSEPVVDSIKLDPKGANAHNLQLLNNRGKQELLSCSLEPVYESITCTSQLFGTRSIKPKPSFDSNKGTVKLLEKSSVQNTDDNSCVVNPSVDSGIACSAEKSFCGTELSVRDDSDQYKQYNQSCQAQHIISSENKRPVFSENDATSLGVGKQDVKTAVSYGFNHPVSYKLDVGNNSVLHSSKNGDGSVSDEEMINLSGDMLEEDSYGSDFESDVNHAVDNMAVDTEQDGGDDDYEDGEVRELPKSTCIEKSMPEKGKIDQIVGSNCAVKKLDSVALVCDTDSSTAYVKEKNRKTEDTAETIFVKNTAETINQNKEEISYAVCMDESDVVSDKNLCVPEIVAVEKPSSEAVLSEPGNATQRSIDSLESKDLQKYQKTGLQSEQNTNEPEGTVAAKFQGMEANFDTTELVQNEDVSKGPTEGDNALKDSSGGSHRSRIIRLPRSSASSSPSKTIPISGRLLPSRVGRDGLLDEDKKQYRGRDNIYFDDNPKFARERYQDRLPRNSRWNFIRGRGRIGCRIDNGDRGSDRDFASEFYNGPAEFHVHRNKYSSAVSNGDLEYSSYNNDQDARFIGVDRAGRRSPGGSRGNHMDRRIPRNMSPGRCISENGSEFVGQRRSRKFLRGFPDDTIDPMFSHSQQSYEGEDGRFGCGNTVFSSVHRRGPPRIRSKSPISSRPRSPGPWSAPRRRFPEGFGGHSDLTHRRSPPIYRTDSTRSPDCPCFPGEVAVRRHDIGDNESGRSHSHSRSAIPSRSPSGQMTIRNRRYNGIDDQGRPDGDDYFEASMHSGRLHELSGEGIADDRRRFGERRGPIRTYRPPYNRADGANFHLKPEDGPRAFRFCPENDREFQERGNSRDREFDRRIRSRPRRIRSIGEQDADYRHDGLDWHEDGFDEISRLKRKRF